jgi:membrane-bound serine protease (ClpP class)
MDVYVLIALIAVALLVTELLLPTGGLLALLGALGLVGAGVVALDSDSSTGEWAGPALITAGVIAAVCFYFVTRKVVEAHRDNRVRTGSEELIGSVADVRTRLDPEGQVWVAGALWGARIAGGDAERAQPGDRVVIEAVDGLTLVVSPEQAAAQNAEQGAS